MIERLFVILQPHTNQSDENKTAVDPIHAAVKTDEVIAHEHRQNWNDKGKSLFKVDSAKKGDGPDRSEVCGMRQQA